ncbi:hypothetical protein BC937DRAFT_86283, partial [Endogone sp. FLAS-F59071]
YLLYSLNCQATKKEDVRHSSTRGLAQTPTLRAIHWTTFLLTPSLLKTLTMLFEGETNMTNTTRRSARLQASNPTTQASAPPTNSLSFNSRKQKNKVIILDPLIF